MDTITYNKKRQEARRVQQIKRYSTKMERYTAITDIATLSYAAGIVDGEGCIMIGKGNASGLRKTAQYNLLVRVSMTAKDVINWLHQTFGGTVVSSRRGEYKRYYCWAVGAIQAEGFLKLIVSYLKCKRAEALLGLEFRDHVNNYIRTNGRIINPEEVAIREQYKLKMEALKRA